jgi:hypothetical protein
MAKCKKCIHKTRRINAPKNPSDLEVTDDLWGEIREGVTWLMEQFLIDSLLQQKYLS